MLDLSKNKIRIERIQYVIDHFLLSYNRFSINLTLKDVAAFKKLIGVPNIKDAYISDSMILLMMQEQDNKNLNNTFELIFNYVKAGLSVYDAIEKIMCETNYYNYVKLFNKNCLIGVGRCLNVDEAAKKYKKLISIS